MSGEISVDWLVGLGGQLHQETGLQHEHALFKDGERILEIYPDRDFAAFSLPGKRTVIVYRMNSRADLAEACRLFRFKIDGLEGVQ